MAIRDFEALARQWSELEAAGISLEPLENRIGVDARSSGSGLTIRRGRDIWGSEIRELQDGVFAYILPIFIRRDRPGKTIIRDSWIEAPWLGATIEFLEDPRIERKHPEWYNFPRETERYWREKVVNHRINRVLSCGNICEGLVLGLGPNPPEDYKNHQQVEVTFGILDQWDNEPSAKLKMRVNRRPARVKARSTRGPLLSRRDVIVPERSLVAPAREESRKEASETILRDIECYWEKKAKRQ